MSDTDEIAAALTHDQVGTPEAGRRSWGPLWDRARVVHPELFD